MKIGLSTRKRIISNTSKVALTVQYFPIYENTEIKNNKNNENKKDFAFPQHFRRIDFQNKKIKHLLVHQGSWLIATLNT